MKWTPLLNGDSNRDKRQQQSKVASGVNVFVVDPCSCVSGNVTVTEHDVPSKTSMFFNCINYQATLSLPSQ